MRRYQPHPKWKPLRSPQRKPIKVVPSGIGDEGIVANYLFYYLEGGDHLHDFSPYDNHGTLTSSNTDRPTWVDGRYGWALDFDGVDDYAKVPDDPSLDLTTSVMVMAWVKYDVVEAEYRQVLKKSQAYHCKGLDAYESLPRLELRDEGEPGTLCTHQPLPLQTLGII